MNTKCFACLVAGFIFGCIVFGFFAPHYQVVVVPGSSMNEVWRINTITGKCEVMMMGRWIVPTPK